MIPSGKITTHLKSSLSCKLYFFRYVNAPWSAEPQEPPVKKPSDLINSLASLKLSLSSVLIHSSIKSYFNILGTSLYPIPSCLYNPYYSFKESGYAKIEPMGSIPITFEFGNLFLMKLLKPVIVPPVPAHRKM